MGFFDRLAKIAPTNAFIRDRADASTLAGLSRRHPFMDASIRDNRDEVFYRALVNGDEIEALGVVLRKNPGDKHRDEALIESIRRGNEAAIGVTLAGGADPRARNMRDESAMDVTISMGEVETLRLLAKNGDHITPEETHSYLAKGKIGSREVVEELILGKQHHRAEDGSTIAHSAARGRRAEHLEVVLSSGVGFGAVDGNGNSMAHTLLGEGGARRHSQELVDYGLRRSDHTPKGIADCLDVTASFGVDLTARNFKGQNALETADPRNLSSDVVGRFRDAGLDLDHKDDEGKTLLDRAVEAGETNAVAAFGGAGADVGRHAGAVGLAMMEVGAAEDLRALGERGVDWISDVGPEKVPFIALEMTKGDPEAVAIETAIYAGVSFDVRDEGGHTPLSLAQEQGRHPGVILPLQIERREAVHGRVVAAVGEKVESTAVREDTQVAPAPSRRVGRSSEER